MASESLFDTMSVVFMMLSYTFIVGAALVLLLYTLLGMQRLYLSPVARVPGPKLAALSFWYEFYYDVVKKGQYTFKIKELHKQYGPVIRINPYEVHINDPEFYDQLYVGSATRPTDKWSWSADMFTLPDGAISTVSHDLHRRRISMFSSNLSTAAINRLEPVIRYQIDRLMQRLNQDESSRAPVAMFHAYSAMTQDIITAYCFGRPSGVLDLPEYAKRFDDAVARTGVLSHFTKQFYWFVRTVQKLPRWVVCRLNGDLAVLFDMQDEIAGRVQEVIKRRNEDMSSDKSRAKLEEASPNTTVFDLMLDAKVPAQEKSPKRLLAEAVTLVIAGTITTAHTLMTITYHLLANPQYLALLKKEIRAAEIAESQSGRPPIETGPQVTLKTLESLPYLNAVIREGLRVGYGVMHRLQRVSPTTTLQCHGYIFPPGTPLSMSAMLMHENEELFPDPLTFDPGRWLPLDTKGAQLYKFLVPFSKGSRQCAGINLAWAELYLTLATLFGNRGKEFQLHDTVFERDVKTTVDGFNPWMSMGSHGMKVLVGKQDRGAQSGT